jgi:hypothetical protein
MPLLTRSEIEHALTRLGELALSQNLQIELIVVGGAAMVLGYNARQATHDVDALIVKPRTAQLVRDLAKGIADELNLAEDWLNDGAKGYLRGLSNGPVIFAAPGIEARQPSVAQLLAMKLSAWRDDVDIADAKRLLQELKADESNQHKAWQAVEPFLIPGDELKGQYAFLDLWEGLHGHTE